MTLYEAAYLAGVLLLIWGITAYDRRRPQTPVSRPRRSVPDRRPVPTGVGPENGVRR